jgi:DNA-binding NtrC family response regulator
MTVRPGCEGYFGLVGASAAMVAVFRLLERVRRTTLPVLVEGATGTGKDAVARLLHAAGPRRGGPFVVVHGGSVASGLVDSVLFGHRRGAFTGALEDRVGAFEAAHGGTLYLDGLAGLGPDVQVRLLRVLEDGWVVPVGASSGRRVDVRVVASWRGAEEAERVREDLLQRVAGVRVALPALAARREDIRALAECFAARYAGAERGLDVEALAWLAEAEWPGNVRQLEGVVRAALALGEGPLVGVAEVRALHGAPAPGGPEGRGTGEVRPIRTLAEVERETIADAMVQLGGNKKRAAEALGIDRSTLYAKLRAHGLA